MGKCQQLKNKCPYETSNYGSLSKNSKSIAINNKKQSCQKSSAGLTLKNAS